MRLRSVLVGTGAAVAVAVAVVMVPNEGEQDPPSSPVPSPSAVGSAAQSPGSPYLRPPTELYVDRFAGFQLRPPRGWVYHSFIGRQSFAPSLDALVAYPDAERYGKAGTFTITFFAMQSRSGEEIRERIERDGEDARRSGATVDTVVRTVAGRSLFWSLTVRDDDVCRCARLDAVMQWDDETAIMIYGSASSPELWSEYGDEVDGMLNSFTHALRHPWADDLRAFLRARVRGSGAVAWLTPEGREAYQRARWLYSIGEGMERDLDITGYDVVSMEQKGGRLTANFYVTAEMGGQGERIVMGPGKNAFGARRSAVVVEMEQTQASGTS